MAVEAREMEKARPALATAGATLRRHALELRTLMGDYLRDLADAEDWQAARVDACDRLLKRVEDVAASMDSEGRTLSTRAQLRPVEEIRPESLAADRKVATDAGQVCHVCGFVVSWLRHAPPLTPGGPVQCFHHQFEDAPSREELVAPPLLYVVDPNDAAAPRPLDALIDEVRRLP